MDFSTIDSPLPESLLAGFLETFMVDLLGVDVFFADVSGVFWDVFGGLFGVFNSLG